MNSKDIAKYIEAKDGISKPWLLVQLRLKKLQERRSEISAEEYMTELTDIHRKTRRKPLALDMGRKSVAVSTAFNISLHN